MAGGAAGPMAAENGPGDGGMRTYESLYVPQRLGGGGGSEMELPQEVGVGEFVRPLVSSSEIGESTVPYHQVYAVYAKAAASALEEQHIPLGLRGTVRDYFSSLEP